jgi:hypothetical protein
LVGEEVELELSGRLDDMGTEIQVPVLAPVILRLRVTGLDVAVIQAGFEAPVVAVGTPVQ